MSTVLVDYKNTVKQSETNNLVVEPKSQVPQFQALSSGRQVNVKNTLPLVILREGLVTFFKILN